MAVATTADIPAAGGMTLLGTLDTTSGTSVTLSSLDLTDYKQLSIFCNAVSSTTANDVVLVDANAIFRATGAFDTSQSFGIATIELGQTAFSSYSSTGGVTYAYGGATGNGFTISNASTSITFSLNTGSFDNGSIRIYGVK